MKILSKQEEEEHYAQVVRGGSVGGLLGLGIGVAGVVAASRRYAAFRGLTPQFRAFLVTSTATFGAIVNADRWSIAYQKSRDPANFYVDQSHRALELARQNESNYKRFMDFGREHRYSIVFASWLASMALALTVVGRNRYLTSAQKLVQARVYAQGLTVLVLVLSAVFEMNDAKTGSGRWETVMVLDPNDPEHKHLIEKKIHREEYEGQDLWKDMVAAEERRLASLKQKKAST